jgi:hypothetical protein
MSGLRRQVRKAQHHGLNARASKLAGLDQGRRPAQALVEAHDRFVSLGSITRPQNLSDLLRRPHHASARAAGLCLSAGQIYRAEGQALLVTGEPRPAAGNQPVGALCR